MWICKLVFSLFVWSCFLFVFLGFASELPFSYLCLTFASRHPFPFWFVMTRFFFIGSGFFNFVVWITSPAFMRVFCRQSRPTVSFVAPMNDQQFYKSASDRLLASSSSLHLGPNPDLPGSTDRDTLLSPSFLYYPSSDDDHAQIDVLPAIAMKQTPTYSVSPTSRSNPLTTYRNLDGFDRLDRVTEDGDEEEALTPLEAFSLQQALSLEAVSPLDF